MRYITQKRNSVIQICSRGSLLKITMRWRGYFTLFLFPCMLRCATFLHPFPDFHIRSLALLLLYGIAAILHVSLEICYVPCNFQQKTLLCVWYVPFSGNFIHATTNFFTTQYVKYTMILVDLITTCSLQTFQQL